MSRPITPFTRGVVGMLIAVLVFALSGCSDSRAGDQAEEPLPSEGPHLSSAQAEALAVCRFLNYRQERVHVTFTNPGGEPSKGEADLDFVNHIGVGTYGDNKTPFAWSLTRVAAAGSGELEDPNNWSSRALTPESAQFDVLLKVMLSLGWKVPDNPALLPQSDAMYLGTRTLFGRKVWVLRGPSKQVAVTASADPSPDASASPGPSASAKDTARTRFWVTSDNRLLRFQAYLGDPGGAMATVDFDPTAPTPSPAPDYIRQALYLEASTATPSPTPGTATTPPATPTTPATP